MTDSTSLDDKSQCVVTIELLGPNYGSGIAEAQGKERYCIKDELQRQVGDDKAIKVTPRHPDEMEAGSMNTLQHVLGGKVSSLEGSPVVLDMCPLSYQTIGTDMS